jgi:hypothetical protein
LLVVLDTAGNVFGGFSPVPFASTSPADRTGFDPWLTSFVFTLKNPHNLPPTRFPVKDGWVSSITQMTGYGPVFGMVRRNSTSGGDLAIAGDCNTNTRSSSCLGQMYTHDTGMDGKEILTGSHHFKVQEVEVFEMTD